MPNLLAYLIRDCEKDPTAVAVADPQTRYTYAQLVAHKSVCYDLVMAQRETAKIRT